MDKYKASRGCPKCGCKTSSDRFQEGGFYIKNKGYIKRRCDRCAYMWLELPLDTEEDSSPRATSPSEV